MVTFAGAQITEEMLRQFAEKGYLVVPGLLDRAEVDRLREAFMAANADGPIPGISEISSSYAPTDPLSFYPRMMHPHRHPHLEIGQLAMQYMLDERLKSVLERLFDDEPIAAQSMFYFKPPGARGQSLHQDNFYLRVKPGNCIAAWVAIDDADYDNGGLVVAPGSNHLPIFCPGTGDSAIFFTKDHVPIPEGLEEVPVTLAAGDVLFFDGSLIHGSYPNTTDRYRRSFICHYVPASSEETSEGYRPLFRFNGEVMEEIGAATGGGPCGGTPEAGPH